MKAIPRPRQFGVLVPRDNLIPPQIGSLCYNPSNPAGNEDEVEVTASKGDSAMRIEDGWLLCTSCDEPVKANADGSYSCTCRRWSGSAFEVELKRLGQDGLSWSLPAPVEELAAAAEEPEEDLGSET